MNNINKILFVDNSLSAFMNFRGYIAKMFVDKGSEVSLLVPKTSSICDIEQVESQGIKVYTYKLPKGKNPLADFNLLLVFINLYKKIKPDLIFHYTIKPNIYGSIAARYVGIECVSIIPGLGITFQKKGFLKNLASFLYKVALRYPKKVWVLNKDDYEQLLNSNLVKQNKLEVLPGEGIDLNFYSSSLKYFKQTPFVFTFIGRLIKEKGIEILIEASKIMKERGLENFEIQVVGGTSKSGAPNYISIDKLQIAHDQELINYVGLVPNTRSLIEKSDCVVLPSFYREGIPRSLMEASAMCRLIITTDSPGCREVVVNGATGFLVKPNDAHDLADCMSEVLSMNSSEILKMGKKGRALMKDRFDAEIVKKHYLNLTYALLKTPDISIK